MLYHLDKGDNLGKSIQVCKLLSHYRYSIKSTATSKPHQNGFIEVKNYEIGHHL